MFADLEGWELSLASPGGAGTKQGHSADPTPWEKCIPTFLHPLKVAIIEAMLWVEEPLSARLIELLLDDGTDLTLLAYHLRCLAEAGVVTKVRAEPVRGVVQTYYEL